MSFYIVLPSNSCPLTRPNNNASEFTVDYENPLILREDWEVALTEFAFSCKFVTIRKGFWFLVNRDTQGQTIEVKAIIEKTKDKLLISYSNPDATNIIELEKNILLFNTMIVNEIVFENLDIAKEYGFDTEKIDVFAVKVVKGARPIKNVIRKSVITLKVKVLPIYEFKIQKDLFYDSVANFCKDFLTTHKDIFSQFTTKHNRITFTVHDTINYILFDKTFSMILGLDKGLFSTETEKTITGIFPPKLQNGINHMYIYTNLTQPIMVGNTKLPLLKSIWMENKYKTGDAVNVVIERPMYLQVASECINKIEVNIRDDSGQPIEFVYGSKSSLTLHFRKKTND